MHTFTEQILMHRKYPEFRTNFINKKMRIALFHENAFIIHIRSGITNIAKE